MKTLFKLFTITFFALLFFSSCQDEVLEETQINEQELLVANSELASLIQSTSARDGRVDNILDHANCLSVNLPVTVIVNDITITINTLEDLELIEDIFEEFDNDDDVLDLLFPITIILNDHEEIVINNQDELDAFVEQCTDDTDDDIECINFQYPISFSIYNTAFQIIESSPYIIGSNKKLIVNVIGTLTVVNGQVAGMYNGEYGVEIEYADGSNDDSSSMDNDDDSSSSSGSGSGSDDDDSGSGSGSGSGSHS